MPNVFTKTVPSIVIIGLKEQENNVLNLANEKIIQGCLVRFSYQIEIDG